MVTVIRRLPPPHTPFAMPCAVNRGLNKGDRGVLV